MCPGQPHRRVSAVGGGRGDGHGRAQLSNAVQRRLALPARRPGRGGVAARAVDDLAGLGISSGPSGAASLAGARAALTGTGAQARRAALGVDGDATVVLVSTEGRQASNPPRRVRQ